MMSWGNERQRDRGLREQLEDSFTAILVVTALGVYALVIVGATYSAVDSGASCSTWPTCDGSWIVPMTDTALVIAMGHRYLSLLVGVLILLATITAWVTGAPNSIRAMLTLVLATFPFQVGLGAITALSGDASLFPALHLLLAMAIFAGVLLTLVWWLEHRTGDVVSTFDASKRIQGSRESSDNTTETETSSVQLARAYLSLTKPRLMWLLCFVALAGIGLATATTGIPVTTDVVIGTLLGGMLAIGSSGTFNHVIERDVDQQMKRTADRPTATDSISVRNAVTFGVLLGVASIAVFLALVNVLAAALGLLAIAFYSVVYTVILKPNTTQNIVIGGAVGAIPALIGWAAITGSIGLPALVLGLLIFLWTPAHFYNLALAYKTDYEQGGFPMLPIERGEAVTLRHIVWYFGATLLAAVSLALVSPLGTLYAVTVVLFAAVFLIAIVQLYEERTPATAFRSFHASNAFLGVMMLVIIIETLFL